VPAVLLALLIASGPADSLAEQGRWYFNHRHLNRTWLDSAAALAARARSFDRFADAAIALDCDARFVRAEGIASRAARLAVYRSAQALADSVRSSRPTSPVGHFFWATATAQVGLIQRNLAALQAMPAVRRAYDRAVELDPRHVGALFGSAMLWAGTPRFAGGSAEKADSLLQLAIGVDPSLTMLRVERARLLVKAKRRAEARVELRRVLDTRNPSVPASYWLTDRSNAEKLLKELGDRK
jgi:predicted Zn-dependent protease